MTDKLKDTLVVPDCHGNIILLYELLKQEGIIDEEFNRINHDVDVVQLGDLCNCVSVSIELDKACLGMAREWFDVYLVGNHELPYLSSGKGSFSGWCYEMEIGRVLRDFYMQGFLKAAHSVGNILITHAGVSLAFKDEIPNGSASQMARFINRQWKDEPKSGIFIAVGSVRGGWHRMGGILWSDWSEPKVEGVFQLVGHTVGNKIRKRENAICIDLGAGKDRKRIAGAWIRNGKIETVTYEMAGAEEENGDS